MRKKIQYLLPMILMMTAACGGDPSFSLLPESQRFLQGDGNGQTNKVDILFMIDNSPSMANNQKKLGESFNNFIAEFSQFGFDYKIAVAGSDAYRAYFEGQGDRREEKFAKFKDGHKNKVSGTFVITPGLPDLATTFLTNVTVGTGGSGDERPFSSMRKALDSPLNAGFLRDDAFLAVIILSDEDDFSSMERRPNINNKHDYDYEFLDPVDDYVNYLDIVKNTTQARKFNVSAITKLDLESCKDGFNKLMGARYIELAQKTDGVLGDICEPDFSSTMESISKRIATLSTIFPLDRVPVLGTIIVQINGVDIPEHPTDGWTYIASKNAIQFNGTAIPESGAFIDVDFTPTTIKN